MSSQLQSTPTSDILMTTSPIRTTSSWTQSTLATPNWVINFLSLLGLLSLAEQFLIISLNQSVCRLYNKIEESHWEGGQAKNADKIVVIQAEINYSRTIQADFITEVLQTPSQADTTRRKHQQNHQQNGRFLTVITNTHRQTQLQSSPHLENDRPVLPIQRFHGRPMNGDPPLPYR